MPPHVPDHISPSVPKRQRLAAPAPPVPSDRLGKSIDIATRFFLSSPSWSAFIATQRGPPEIAPSVQYLPHPAAQLLHRIRKTGVPVLTQTPPWTPQQILDASLRGSHQSAKHNIVSLREEMADMIDQRFWVVLPFELIKHLPNLCLSPMGVVPQRDRRARPIVDYSFSGINADSVPLAPAEAMQFGRTFERLLHRIHHANHKFGPVYMIKVDLSDGFYRVRLTDSHLPLLGVAFPNLPGEPPLVALPLVLPMGWVASPPFFCSLTETIADVANHRLKLFQAVPPHRLSRSANQPMNYLPVPLPPAHVCPTGPLPAASSSEVPAIVPTTLRPSIPFPLLQPPFQPRLPSRPLSTVDVYMDDFLALAQGHPGQRQFVRSTLFHTIDEVLCPLTPSDGPHRKEPISMKKLHKGDCLWETRKIMLGWIVDSIRETIELPAHRAERLHQILQSLISRKRISTHRWQQQLGELRSMVLALPGGRGLFSTLYTGLTQSPHRIRLIPPIKDALIDLQYLANDLSARPTRLGEIVDSLPAAYGAADASGLGMGGIWLSGDPTFVPTVWRHQFPPCITANLVTWENPTGVINNSDLELAAQLASQDVIIHQRNCCERSLALFTDNLAARSWLRKGSRTTLGPAAYLLRIHALHQRHYRYRSTADYLSGPANQMADDASRLWHLSNDELLSHFNSHYPQNHSWQISHLRPAMLSALITALQCKRSAPASFLYGQPPVTHNGFDGLNIAAHWRSLQPWKMSPIPLPCSKSLHTDTALVPLPPVVTLSALVPWKMPSGPLARRYPAWGPRTLVSTPKVNSITSYNNNSEVTHAMTLRLPGSNPSRSPSFSI